MLMPDYTLSSIFVCANVCIRVHLCHIVSQYVYVSNQSYLLLDIIFYFLLNCETFVHYFYLFLVPYAVPYSISFKWIKELLDLIKLNISQPFFCCFKPGPFLSPRTAISTDTIISRVQKTVTIK